MSDRLATEDRAFLRQMYQHLRVNRARQAARRADKHAGTGRAMSESGHIVFNVYGEERVETVRNAMRAAEERGDTETAGEAVHALARAYTGRDATEEGGGA